MEEVKTMEVETQALAEVKVANITNLDMWSSREAFELTQRMATLLAKSDLVPQAYQNNISNCVLAISMARQMNIPPFAVMQNSQVVKGKFTWTGTACKSMIDNCGKYKKSKYVMVGTPNSDDFGCYLEAVDNDGETIKGVTVTVAMAKAEGWYNQNPKWRNMTELMLKYRAAGFFMRTECASLAMGFRTAEEEEDIDLINNKKDILDELD